MVYYCGTDFRKTIDICFARTVISTFYSIIEKAVYGIVVVLIILGRIDSSLSCNGMGSAGGVTDTEYFNIVSKLSQGCCGGSSGQSCSNHYDVKLSLVVGTYKADFRLAPGPFFRQGSGRNL